MSRSDGSVNVELTDDELLDGAIDDAIVTQNEDGSAIVDMEEPEEIYDPANDPDIHDANLAEFIPENILGQLADDLCEKIDTDDKSRADWKGQLAEGMKLLGLTMEDRTYPFKNASGAIDPMMLEAIVRIMAEGSGELIPPAGPVKSQIIGASDTARGDRATRGKDFMNLYFTKWAPEYYPDFKQMLFWWGFAGSTFKKVYQDPLKRRPVAPYIRADNFIVSYNTSDLFSCPRMTQLSTMTLRQVRSLQLSKVWRDIDLGDTTPDAEIGVVQDAADAASGVMRPSFAGDEEFDIYESHLDIDLRGFEHRVVGKDVPSGLPIPYRVSIDKRNQKILAIRRNWKEGDNSFEKMMQFVHYKLIEGPGFYGLGYAHLLGQLTKTASSLTRQIIDAETLNMFPGGFKVKGMRLEENSLMIGPCTWIELDTGGVPISQAFSAMPYKEVSPVTLATLQEIRETSRGLASSAEIMTGEGRQDAPVGTTVALMEAAKKVQSQMIKSAHQSMKEEFGLFKNLFGIYLPEEPYPFPVRGGMSSIMRADFAGEVDFIPVSDPNITSSSQRLILAQARLTMGQSAPPGTHDISELYKQVYQSMGMTDDQIALIMPPPSQARPMDPLSENQAALTGGALKAGLEQDHDAHIEVHKVLGDNPVMQAHMAEHTALKMRQQVERVLGMPLPPPGAQLPPDIENEIAILTAKAMRVLEQERGGPDPTAAQIAMQDLQIKAAAVQERMQAAAEKTSLGYFQARLKAETDTKNRQSKERIELLRASANTADNQNPPIPYIKEVLNLGIGDNFGGRNG